MGKILAIDFGSKRLGLAISNEDQTIAFPLQNSEIKSSRHAVTLIIQTLEKESVKKIVIGLPLNMNGSEGFACESVREFVTLMQKQISLPVEFCDERLTTLMAERSLLEGDLSRNKRKSRKDKIAATILLQDYLDRQNIHRENG